MLLAKGKIFKKLFKVRYPSKRLFIRVPLRVPGVEAQTCLSFHPLCFNSRGDTQTSGSSDVKPIIAYYSILLTLSKTHVGNLSNEYDSQIAQEVAD